MYKNSKIEELAERFKEYGNTAANVANTVIDSYNKSGDIKELKEIANNTFTTLINNENIKPYKEAVDKFQNKIQNKITEYKEILKRPEMRVNYIWDKENHEIKIIFGKNGQGLTDEFITIGKFIKKLSLKANVYIEDAFMDGLDDVYNIKLKYYYKKDYSNI